jgi:hypothetical protein
MTHQCPVRVCPAVLPDHLLMCRPHWFMVPPALRNAVWAAYRNGAGTGTLALHAAQVAAIRAVERRPARDSKE